MSERIRYTEVSGSQESIQVFKHETNGAQYKVRIMPPTQEDNAYKWLVIDANLEIVAVSGRHLNRNKAQLQVRSALKDLGVNLITEKRSERTKKNV